jgi:Catalytic LigB subunit of aromatic ring-opening dioxygenase
LGGVHGGYVNLMIIPFDFHARVPSATSNLVANGCTDRIAFDPKKNPLNVPIVQASLFNSEDVEQHYRLGQALESLRDEGFLIIGAGMAVHNLRDFRAMRGTGRTMP